MNSKVGIIIGNELDLSIMQEATKVLSEYGIDFEVTTFIPEMLDIQLPTYAKEAYLRGVRVIIAGTRGDANYSNSVASYFNIPTIGIPCKVLNSHNSLESLFSVLQQPNEHAVANVAFDSGQNAGILAVQILALSNTSLQKKILSFKENLKMKILKANEELSKIKFDYKTN